MVSLFKLILTNKFSLLVTALLSNNCGEMVLILKIPPGFETSLLNSMELIFAMDSNLDSIFHIFEPYP